MDFKSRLRGLRNESGLTQAELAKIFRIAPTTLSSWEQGRSKPDLEEVAQIASHFNVAIDYLLGATDEKAPERKYHYSIRELKEQGLAAEDVDNEVIKFKNLMAKEDITPEWLEEILPIIKALKEHMPKS